MKFEHNWRYKSIENLEKDNWGDVPTDESSIVTRAMRLRKIPLNEFSIDDVRFLLIQEIGLPYLLTIALEYLEKDLFTEGNYYEGDLLNSVLSIKDTKWKGLKIFWVKVNELITPRLDELKAEKLNIDNFYLAKFE